MCERHTYNTINKYFLFIIIFFCSKILPAQDVHLSQFFSAPLVYNAANTGLFNGFYRVGGNYKNQWMSIPVPYHTGSIYADMAWGRKRKNEYGVAGTGLCIVQDVAGDGNLSVSKIGVTNALHLALDIEKNHYISLGLGINYVQKRINFSKLFWGAQWDGTKFNSGLSSQQSFAKNTYGFVDINAGVRYTALIKNNFLVHYGGSATHINKPRETFLGNDDNQLKVQWLNNIGSSFYVKERFLLYNELIFVNQGKAHEFLVFNMLSYALNDIPYKSQNVLVGLNIRWKDAIVPVIGYEVNAWRFLINYDVNVSSLWRYTNLRGGLEISAVHIGDNLHDRYSKPRIIPCPVF